MPLMCAGTCTRAHRDAHIHITHNSYFPEIEQLELCMNRKPRYDGPATLKLASCLLKMCNFHFVHVFKHLALSTEGDFCVLLGFSRPCVKELLKKWAELVRWDS